MPSERTIEALSNHALLEIINSGKTTAPFAWLFVPHQLEEQHFAFDANMIGVSKRLYIQYKSRKENGIFKLSLYQIWQLCSYLPRHERPYVFLSGNYSSGYAVISADHELGGRYTSFDKTFFIDVWAVLDEVLWTFTGGLLPAQSILPPVTDPCDADIMLQVSGLNFLSSIKAGTKLADALQNLCFELNYFGPTGCGTTGIIPSAGNGVAFARKVLTCKFGRDLASQSNVPVERRLDINERWLHSVTVVTVPMVTPAEVP
jgi:hypothetical protein